VTAVFATKKISVDPDNVAPDGSMVRVLLALDRGSMAHFSLVPGQVSVAVHPKTVEEIWFVIDGRGEIWRRSSEGEDETAPLAPGVCLTIPLGTQFQFRSGEDSPLAVLGVTMPPWPLDRVEAVKSKREKWKSTLTPGPGLAES
jgi:mannose-6-phosphate isomerase-like protein (cupin superfamily)